MADARIGAAGLVLVGDQSSLRDALVGVDLADAVLITARIGEAAKVFILLLINATARTDLLLDGLQLGAAEAELCLRAEPLLLGRPERFNRRRRFFKLRRLSLSVALRHLGLLVGLEQLFLEAGILIIRRDGACIGGGGAGPPAGLCVESLQVCRQSFGVRAVALEDFGRAVTIRLRG